MRRSFMAPSMVAAGLVLASLSWSAAAQFAKPEEAIHYRRAVFTVMGTHFGRVAAMATKKVPFDAKAVALSADIATMMSKLPCAAFVEGSDLGDTRAEPKIWTEMDKFRGLASKRQAEMVKLDAAAKTGNVDAIKAAVADTGKARKACHDVYGKE